MNYIGLSLNRIDIDDGLVTELVLMIVDIDDS